MTIDLQGFDLWVPYIGRVGSISRHNEAMFSRVAEFLKPPPPAAIVSPWEEVGEGCRMALPLPPAE